jgi:1,4-alpha-glucan branching enzyme
MHRYKNGGPKDSVVVVLNFSSQTFDDYKVGFPREGSWKLRFNSDNENYDPDFSNLGVFNVDTMQGEFDNFQQFVSLQIPPYTALIFSQEE